MSATMIRLTSDEDLARALPVMRQLEHPLESLEEFIARMREIEKQRDYRLFALEADGDIACLCGVMPMRTMFYECLCVCELVTDVKRRSDGLGRKLLTQVEEWGIREGYRGFMLTSAERRTEAHRFYQEKMGYEKTGFVFYKKVGRS